MSSPTRLNRVFEPGADCPAVDAFAVTPSDSDDLAVPARALYIGVAGNISIITPKGNTVSFVNLLSGTILPVEVARVRLTGTTAASIVALC